LGGSDSKGPASSRYSYDAGPFLGRSTGEYDSLTLVGRAAVTIAAEGLHDRA
jgi:hypothetical protein